MAKGRKGSAIQKTLAILAYGREGTRKSSLGAEAIALKRADGKPMRVLVIDAEFGGFDSAVERVAQEHNVNLDNTYILYTEDYNEIMDIFKQVKNNEDFYEYDEEGNVTDTLILDADGEPFRPDFIVVDGTTVIYNASSIAKIKFSEKRARVKAKASGKTAEETAIAVQGADLEFKDYKKLNVEMSQEFILGLIATGKHFYVTARETDEKEKRQVTDSKGNVVSENFPTGRKIAEGFKGMEFNVGTVLHLTTDDFESITAKVMQKDRTGLYKPFEVVTPSLLAFQPVLDANKGKEKVLVNPTFAESVDKMFKKEVEENEVNNESEPNVEGYKKLIQEAMSKIQAKNKPVISTALKSKGLTPASYKEMTSTEELKEFLKIIEG